MDDERQLPSHSPLGRSSDYPDRYDAGLLFPMQRIASRQSLGLVQGHPLPFSGIDRWHAWEISWLDPHGKPQVAIGRFDIPADSLCMVESKSLKLYLNSYNNERMVSREAVRALIETDLSAACQAGVMVELYALDALPARVGEQGGALPGDSIDAPELSFDCYQPDASLLSAGGDPVEECLRSDLLKTNCPVTLQPDWATLVVRYRGPRIDREGLLRYVVSFRNHADFHEHCVERIYMDLLQRCRPERLTVNAFYTRRGGLDINPWRSNFEQPDARFVKLARQ
ncbi:MAG: NADPH-dependent 7-cyano-7-deazaguanine reductase QueF [Methyloversatilis sp.]|nr:NADPH-dependent 7-cyano-7-deazaguanine reductase QueF [Methyloversatilis sp.]